MTHGTVLLVDDEEKILKTLGRALREEEHEVTTTSSPQEALRLLGARQFDVLIVDYLMPGLTGMDVVREVQATLAETERPGVLMMTAHGSVRNAVEAMKLGVRDYLQKPFDIDELLVSVRRTVEEQQARSGLRYLLSEQKAQFGQYGIVGHSRAVQEVIARVELVARSRSTVLITGETGTGKELVARAIHDRSAERTQPLIRVNCAALPESLLESELFGHVRGAFTGAVHARKGRFALADGGSIFLDEISTISGSVQAKLLRVLQEKEFEPLGAERTQKVDVRVIAATNRDLQVLAVEGRFQNDLYYRLNVIPIRIPPLRERREDIPVLVEHFMRRIATSLGKPDLRVEDGALDTLVNYGWPGNVRELENTIERAVVLATGPTITRDLVLLMPGAQSTGTGLPSGRLHENVSWAERESILAALRASGGVKKDAAESLGISQRALSHYLGKHGID
ncbi:sigma-54 dependent transcriptional regulator [Luteitalea sp.]|uniref:sigma-54-dependent transcriptional regulator n=1 Tax=Luteitalea sp. TaxID=2004800 RepID=UPI0025C2D0C8|nr:sigma-54 dependent transcriptional regulator [Luteitalea sp.]